MNSRNKGNKGEREAAKVVGTWTDKKFARVPSSGGLQWKNSNAKGDIVCTEEGHYFPFCMEIKSYGEINFEHLLYLDKADVRKFWAQCIRDAEIANKCPMLWMRYNRLPVGFFFIMIPSDIYDQFFHPYMEDGDRVMIFPVDKLAVLTTNSLSKIPYKKIRKRIKALYKK
jgi:Holliday junction resolvase